MVLRDVEILKYVEDNPECTKTEVINYINPSSPVPTHRAIKRLILEKKIISKPDSSNSQVHHLHINDNNSFVLINRELSKIEAIINAMYKPMHRMAKLIQDENPAVINYEFNCISPYLQSISAMLRVLSLHTNTIITSLNDTQILHNKITELLTKLILQFNNMDEENTLLMLKRHDLNIAKEALTAGTGGPHFGTKIVSVKRLSNLIAKIDDFREKFLIKQLKLTY